MTDRSTVTSSTVTGSATTGSAPSGGAIPVRHRGYPLMAGQATVTVRDSTVGGDTQIARRALEPLAAAGAKPAPSAASKPARI